MSIASPYTLRVMSVALTSAFPYRSLCDFRASSVYLLYVFCVSSVCLLYVICISTVCHLYIYCMSSVYLLYVFCVSTVCLLYIYCLSSVYLMYVLCVSTVFSTVNQPIKSLYLGIFYISTNHVVFGGVPWHHMNITLSRRRAFSYLALRSTDESG